MVRKPMAKWMKSALACLAMFVICIGGSPRLGFAADYPELDGITIRVIISGAPGETSDTLARSFLKSLEAELPKVTIWIQNIPGGDPIIGGRKWGITPTQLASSQLLLGFE